MTTIRRYTPRSATVCPRLNPIAARIYPQPARSTHRCSSPFHAATSPPQPEPKEPSSSASNSKDWPLRLRGSYPYFPHPPAPVAAYLVADAGTGDLLPGRSPNPFAAAPSLLATRRRCSSPGPFQGAHITSRSMLDLHTFDTVSCVYSVGGAGKSHRMSCNSSNAT